MNLGDAVIEEIDMLWDITKQIEGNLDLFNLIINDV